MILLTFLKTMGIIFCCVLGIIGGFLYGAGYVADKISHKK